MVRTVADLTPGAMAAISPKKSPTVSSWTAYRRRSLRQCPCRWESKPSPVIWSSFTVRALSVARLWAVGVGRDLAVLPSLHLLAVLPCDQCQLSPVSAPGVLGVPLGTGQPVGADPQWTPPMP
jgi:hypothetical protein